MEYRTRVITPEGWTDNQRGDFFEELMAGLFKKQRYRVLRRVRFTGMEIDLLLEHQDTGRNAYAECKFHKDNIQAPVLYALIGKANSHKVDLAYLLSTAALGKEAHGVVEERNREEKLSPQLISIGPERLTDWFLSIENARMPEPSDFGISIARAGDMTLIVRPTDDRFWLLEEKSEGIPSKGIIIDAKSGNEASLDLLRHDFQRLSLWSGLEIVQANAQSSDRSDSQSDFEEEVVTSVGMAERYDDYRPCRPEDFVGRTELQKSVWDFLSLIDQSNTETRVVSFVGPSGFGKSSVILKLADRFRNKKWRNRFYFYPLDVRSAKGPLFVAKAMKLAFQASVNDGFIEGDSIEIDSTEHILSSTSIQEALKALEENNRVLVVFFDQFEELFSKESLLETFDQFRRLAYEVDSLQGNLVLGFSWRTGITFSEDHPAYYMWQDLRDKRLEFKISEFESKESSLLITQFEKHGNISLEHQLRRRLIEQCQGFPWLLKKLCIHVFEELAKGTRSSELTARRLNIKRLFDEDLEPLTSNQVGCLKYIAEHSPADILEVIDVFGQDTVNQLAQSRLVIRAGQKYAVYWDIFREYLVNDSVPAIPLTYIPIYSITMLMKVFRHLQQGAGMDVQELCSAVGFSEKTMVNVVADLQAFNLASRNNTVIAINPDILGADSMKIANFLAHQLRDHIVFQAAVEGTDGSRKLSMDELHEIFRSAYKAASYRSEVISAYANRLLQWLTFAGLTTTESDGIILHTDAQGSDKGRFSRSNLESAKRGRKGKGNFLCASGPDQASELALQLFSSKRLSRDQIKVIGYRNSAYDLSSLGLAEWNGGELVANVELTNLAIETDLKNAIISKIRQRALNSPFLSALSELLSQKPNALPSDCAILGESLGYKWSEPSAKRYLSGGKAWLAYCIVAPTDSAQLHIENLLHN